MTRKAIDAGCITPDYIQKVKELGEKLHALARSCGTEDMSMSVSDKAVFATIFFRDADGVRRQYSVDVFEDFDHVEVRGTEWEKEDK